eukprot:12267344-Karenia_brevis.AAC.1
MLACGVPPYASTGKRPAIYWCRAQPSKTKAEKLTSSASRCVNSVTGKLLHPPCQLLASPMHKTQL